MRFPEGERLGAVLGFRLYNRVETLEALREGGWCAQEVFPRLRPAINATAYKISMGGRLFPLDLIAQAVDRATRAARSIELRQRAEYMCGAIRGTIGVGPFLSYQIALDLRWIRGPYSDEDTWCVLGLGACRGLARLAGVYVPGHWKEKERKSEEMEMRRLMGFAPTDKELALAPRALTALGRVLPAVREVLPGASMMDLEHNLCEWDKYERILAGEGTGRAWRPTQ